MTRVCAWCRGAIADTMRADAVCCSKRCRQARHRFTTGVGQVQAVVDGHPRRLAYADPPYPGKSHYYRGHPDYAGEVDHPALIASLSADYDAWALSTSAEALPQVLASCPPGVRVAAWCRGARPHASATIPLNSWEPVIYAGAIATCRTSTDDASSIAGRRIDSLVFNSRPRLADPNRVIGAKPAVFCRWVFELLGAQLGDTFVDVFPGSGGVARAWDMYTGSGRDASSSTVVTTDASRRTCRASTRDTSRLERGVVSSCDRDASLLQASA